jgi:hypothetical protein
MIIWFAKQDVRQLHGKYFVSAVVMAETPQKARALVRREARTWEKAAEPPGDPLIIDRLEVRAIGVAYAEERQEKVFSFQLGEDPD